MKKLNFKKLIAVISLLATTASVASLGAYAKPGDPTSDSSQQRMEEETQSTPKVEKRSQFMCIFHNARLNKITDEKYECPRRSDDSIKSCKDRGCKNKRTQNPNTPCGIENFNPKTDKYYIDGEVFDPLSTPNPAPTPKPTYGIENSWKSFPVFNKLSTTALVTNPNKDKANPVEFELKDNDLNGFTKFYIEKPDTLKLNENSANELIEIISLPFLRQLKYESNMANQIFMFYTKYNSYALDKKRPKVDKKKEETKPKKENSGFISNTCKKTREAVTNLCNSLKKVWPAKAPTQNADTNTVTPDQNTEANTAAPEQNTDPNRQTSSFNPFNYFK